MKKIILYSAVTLTLFACKKDQTVQTAKPSITLLAPSGGETYQAREYVTVKWKSTNLPFGSVILATLSNTGSVASQGVYIYPQTETTVSLLGNSVPATSNDGIEIFQMPHDTSIVYRGNGFNFGNSFKLKLIAVYPVNGIWTTVEPGVGTFETSSNDFFSVYNCGCTSLAGYSTITGQPCTN